MTHPIDRFENPSLSAPLFFTPCPGTQSASAAEALDALQQAGARAVVTLMPSEELERHGIPDLGALCKERGLQWFHLPIGDDDAPSSVFEASWQDAAPCLFNLIDSGNAVAIHCRGGSGRTGLIAARLIAAKGEPVDRAVSAVQALRPKALRSELQVQWLKTRSIPR